MNTVSVMRKVRMAAHICHLIVKELEIICDFLT